MSHYNLSSCLAPDGSENLFSSPENLNLTWHRGKKWWKNTHDMTLIPWYRTIVPWISMPIQILKEMNIPMDLQLTLLVGESRKSNHVLPT